MATAPPMTAAVFAEAADVSRETLARLDAYAALLRQWQRAMNLVAADSLDDLWRRHMLDSAQLARLLPPEAGAITDLGSGAGFPGLVLAIVAGRPVHLVESSAKKAAFLREAARITAAPATVHHGRVERLEAWPSQVVTARALAPLETLLAYAAPYLAAAGPEAAGLFLKGAQGDAELADASKSWTMTVERFKSATDPRGVIFRIRGLAFVGPAGKRRR